MVELLLDNNANCLITYNVCILVNDSQQLILLQGNNIFDYAKDTYCINSIVEFLHQEPAQNNGIAEEIRALLEYGRMENIGVPELVFE